MEENKQSGSELPAWGCFIMTMTFLVLKLCGKIAWPWIWIFSPIWIPIVAFFAILILTLIVALIGAIITKISK